MSAQELRDSYQAHYREKIAAVRVEMKKLPEHEFDTAYELLNNRMTELRQTMVDTLELLDYLISVGKVK